MDVIRDMIERAAFILAAPGWVATALLLAVAVIAMITILRLKIANAEAPTLAREKTTEAEQSSQRAAGTDLNRNLDESRSVRIFLSSTFLDMQEERDILVTSVFPALRAKYRERGVEIFEVDLRWGITAEDQQRGDTLPILLAEIDRCRPYFIGLLGDRYGWVPSPDAIRSELAIQYPVLNDAAGLSVTAIEFLYGLSPRDGAKAVIFERDTDRDWRAKLDPVFSGSDGQEDLTARSKLTALKDMARAHAPIERFSSPEDLRQLVFDRVDRWLDEQFPASSTPDSLEQSARVHRAYSRERRVMHIGATSYLEKLNAWAESAEAPPTLITGPSGAGKSALIANWANSQRLRHPDAFVFEHYVGASADSAEPRAILGRLWAGLDRFTGVTLAVPSTDVSVGDLGNLVAERLAALTLSAQSKPLVVGDGLDKLSEAAEWLGWLPAASGVRILASVVDGPAKDTALAIGFVPFAINPLSDAERLEFIHRTLGRWRRKLTAEHIAAVLSPKSAALAGSPLYLKTVLEELRVSADNARLSERLEDYRSATDMLDLFDRVIARLEDDCEDGILAQVLPLIWASREGLEESELLTITGRTPLAWATLRNGLGDNLWDQTGRMAFGHDYLRQAVERRYLQTQDQKEKAHGILAQRYRSTFATEAAIAAKADADVSRYEKTKDGFIVYKFQPRARSRTQLLHHLQQAKDWSGIAALLADDTFFAALPPAAYGSDWDRGPILQDQDSLHPRHLFLLDDRKRMDHALLIATAFGNQAKIVRNHIQEFPKSGRSESLGIPNWAETGRRLKETSPREFGRFRDLFYTFKRLMVLANDWALVAWDGSDSQRERLVSFFAELKDAASLYWLLNEYGREMTGLSGALEDNASGDALLPCLMAGKTQQNMKVDFYERVSFLGPSFTRGKRPINALGPGAVAFGDSALIGKLLRRVFSVLLSIAHKSSDIRASSEVTPSGQTMISIAATRSAKDVEAQLSAGNFRYDLFVIDLISKLHNIDARWDWQNATVRLTLPLLPPPTPV